MWLTQSRARVCFYTTRGFHTFTIYNVCEMLLLFYAVGKGALPQLGEEGDRRNAGAEV